MPCDEYEKGMARVNNETGCRSRFRSYVRLLQDCGASLRINERQLKQKVETWLAALDTPLEAWLTLTHNNTRCAAMTDEKLERLKVYQREKPPKSKSDCAFLWEVLSISLINTANAITSRHCEKVHNGSSVNCGLFAALNQKTLINTLRTAFSHRPCGYTLRNFRKTTTLDWGGKSQSIYTLMATIFRSAVFIFS